MSDPSIDHEDFSFVVSATTRNKLSTFLYELAVGTQNYRSLHSLTEQVEHQYHGRFAIELLQNAHDALPKPDHDPQKPAQRRIEFALRPNGEFGTLYVANDGNPFSRRNFNSVSQLGQSDKSPRDSIGNKGIGFRSVLEVSHTPTIWSRCSSSSASFDGFCFTFDRSFVASLKEPISHLATRGVTPHVLGMPMVEWDTGLIDRFAEATARMSKDSGRSLDSWIEEELRFLSPYLLPVPMSRATQDGAVDDFEARGFASVVALPLVSEATGDLVRERLAELNADALLFLDRVSELVVDDGRARRTVHRSSVPITQHRSVTISTSEEPTLESRYLIWTHRHKLVDAPNDVRDALSKLPGRWPELDEFEVSLAVPTQHALPVPGKLCIFLPTTLSSGSAAHINAPFFGDMSRTLISFASSGSSEATYNDYLLRQVAELAFTAIERDLAGKSATEAAAIVDLLSPTGASPGASERWQGLMANIASAQGVELAQRPWALTDGGWVRFEKARLTPIAGSPRVITAELLHASAAFAQYAPELAPRRAQIEAWGEHNHVRVHPTAEELAAASEFVARQLHESGGADWKGFWNDVQTLLPNGLGPLIGKQVLICLDGQLHEGGGKGAVYFQPRQGLADDEDQSGGDVENVPASLSHLVAILHPDVPVYEETTGPLRHTALYQLLSSARLVSPFRREAILEQTLVANLPPLPLRLTDPKSDLCRDILTYGLRLVASMQVRGTGEAAFGSLRKLLAPCLGGWLPLGAAMFGAGWHDTSGGIVSTYLELAGGKSAAVARRRLLQPPNHRHWAGQANTDLLRLAGVSDGLRLTRISAEQMPGRFQATKWAFQVPKTEVPGLSPASWTRFSDIAKRDAKPSYNTGTYELGTLFALPGFEDYENFQEPAREAFMNVVLASAPKWGDGWARVRISRRDGNSDLITLPSPLLLDLTVISWIGVRTEAGWTWHRPHERWHVPQENLSRNRQWHFDHLNPLPVEMAATLDRNPDLSAFLRQLGLPRYDSEAVGPSPRLLNDLAKAVEANSFKNRDILLGQVRAAWAGFEPSPADGFPPVILVHRADGQLVPVGPTAGDVVYLPDARVSPSVLRRFELPLVAIEPRDAQRLSTAFVAAYPGGVSSSAGLRLRPRAAGQAWRPNTTAVRLHEVADVEWIVPVVLAIAAFHGPNARGTASSGFSALLDVLRSARVEIADGLEVALSREGETIAKPQAVAALWVADEVTLLLDETWREHADALADAVSQAMQRDDLRYAIRHSLDRIMADPADKDLLSSALDQLDLTIEHYRTALEHWRGDLGPAIERLARVLRLVDRPDAADSLSGASTDDQVMAALTAAVGNRSLSELLFEHAREARDVIDFGRRARSALGAPVELALWNADVLRAGETPVRNTRALSEFRDHLHASSSALRGMLAKLSQRNPAAPAFPELDALVSEIQCPEPLLLDFWEVSFQLAWNAILQALSAFLTDAEVSALSSCTSATECRLVLSELGLVTSRDPLEMAADNRAAFDRLADEVEQIVFAWTTVKGLGAERPKLNSDALTADRLIYVQQLQPSEMLARVLQGMLVLPEEVRQVIAASASPEEIRLKLDITQDQIDQATTEFDRQRADDARKKRLVQVCGDDFENTDDGQKRLWGHVSEKLSDEQLLGLSFSGIDAASSLKKLLKRSPRGENSNRPAVPPIKRLSKGLETLVGNAGEMHAFRRLRSQYGPEVISPSNWVSAASLLAFPDNTANVDEGRGCDLVFQHEGRTYMVEIKSSDGEPESFTLGSSEIRLAMEAVSSKARRAREVFVVLRVRNALTSSPMFDVLPNPYDSRYSDYFRVEEAGARISYSL